MSESSNITVPSFHDLLKYTFEQTDNVPPPPRNGEAVTILSLFVRICVVSSPSPPSLAFFTQSSATIIDSNHFLRAEQTTRLNSVWGAHKSLVKGAKLIGQSGASSLRQLEGFQSEPGLADGPRFCRNNYHGQNRDLEGKPLTTPHCRSGLTDESQVTGESYLVGEGDGQWSGISPKEN